MLHVRRTTDRTRLGGARAPLCAFVCCLFALGLVGPARAATNNIFTVAGTLTVSGSTGDGGPATTAKLNHPTGVAATADGGFLIADADNEAVRRVSPAGTITTVAGTLTVSGSTGDGGPATAAKLNFPAGVAATADGGFLIADQNNHAIRRVSPAGTITTVAGTLTVSGPTGDGGPATAATLNFPTGVAATADGGYLIADTGNHAIRFVDADLRPGPSGPQGPSGGPGPRGPRGPQGAPGRNAKVTCTVKKSKRAKKVKVTCKVVLVKKTSTARIQWRLLRRGHAVAHGVARAQHGRLQLRLSHLGHLRRGRYTLRIAGRRAGTTIVIR